MINKDLEERGQSDEQKEICFSSAVTEMYNLDLAKTKVQREVNDRGVQMKRNSKGKALTRKTLLDSGANMSATGCMSMLINVRKNVTISVKGTTGKCHPTAVGTHKMFGTEAVLMEKLSFDILAMSLLEENHQIEYIYGKGVFVARKIYTNMYYIFSQENGMYFTDSERDVSYESVAQALDEYPDRRIVVYDKLGIVESWHTRSKMQIGKEEQESEKGTFEMNALETDMLFARKMMGEGKRINESLLKHVESLRMIHLGLGHPGKEPMTNQIVAHNKTVIENKNKGRNLRNARVEIPKEAEAEYHRIFGTCTTCAMAKMTSDQNHWRSPYDPKEPGAVIHVDWTFYCETGNKCFFVSIDDLTGYAYVVHSQNKTGKSASAALEVLINHYEQHKHPIKNVYGDNDPSFSDKYFGMHQVFVKNETSGAHNSKIERFVRTWKNIILAMKVDFGMEIPDMLIHKLMKYACDSYNMRHDWTGESPFSKFYGRSYSLELLNRHFGELVVAANNYGDMKADVGIIVGRVMGSDRSFEFLNLKTMTISEKSKFTPVTTDRERYIELVKKMDCKLVFGINAGIHEKKSCSEKLGGEFSEINEVIEESKDIDPALLGKYSKNKNWTIEKLLFYYMKGEEKFFRVKWSGFLLLNDSCDMSESKLLDTYSITDLRAIPSLRTFKLRNKESKMIFITNVSVNPKIKEIVEEEKEKPLQEQMNDEDMWEAIINRLLARKEKPSLAEERLINSLLARKETPSLAEEHANPKDFQGAKNLSGENMTMAEGLEQNPVMAKEGIYDEVRTILEFKTWEYVHAKDLTEKQLEEVISCFMFLKNKFGVDNVIEKIKARLVGGGHMQDKIQLDPELISSTTLRTASYNIIVNIAAFEDRDLSVIDIRSAYLQASLPEGVVVFMLIRKDLADIIIELDPSAIPFLNEKGQLYVRLKKALYGLIQSAKIWYNCLISKLAVIGYYPLPNNMDPNVVIKVMSPDEEHDEEWISILGIHVDDIGIASSKKETMLIKIHLTDSFGEVKFQSGDEMDWLGIHIVRDRKEKTITLSQISYVERMLSKFKGMLEVEKFIEFKTPAESDLFTTNDNFKTQDLQLKFLSILMSIAFLAYRTRPDLLTVVSYLATRVLHNDPRDMEALIRLIGYIQYTKDKVLRLSPTGLKIFCWTDASYGNHFGGRGHSGILISMSHDEIENKSSGFLYAMSSKQKHVAQSTAEAELIAQAEGLKYVLWIRNMLAAITNKEVEPSVIFYQDNMAAIQMAITGTGKFKNTKHIEHRMFLITNHLDSDHIEMKFCPTERMIPDLLTKTTFSGPKIASLTASILNEL